jgi:hypothetical protein
MARSPATIVLMRFAGTRNAWASWFLLMSRSPGCTGAGFTVLVVVFRDFEGMAIYRNNAGETWKNSASLRMCALLGSRFPLMTSDATLRDPKTGNRSACFRARAP